MKILPLNESAFSNDDFVRFLIAINKDFQPPLTDRLSLKSNVKTLNEYAEKLITNAHIFICENNKLIVGAIAFYANDFVNNVSYIPILGISGNYRKLGIGKLLINSCLDYVLKMGISKVRVETWDNNDAAINLYKKSGFIIEGKEGFNVKLLWTEETTNYI